jgi:hypothetical protein
MVVELPLELPSHVVREASNLYINKGYFNGGKEVKKGRKLENLIYGIFTLLDAIPSLAYGLVNDDIYYPSYLDAMGIDIMLDLGNTHLCYQIKSSIVGMKVYKETELSLRSVDRRGANGRVGRIQWNGVVYPSPGVLFVNVDATPRGWKLALLREVSRITGVGIRREVLSSIKLITSIKNSRIKTLPSKVFELEVKRVLTVLSLIEVKGDKIYIL